MANHSQMPFNPLGETVAITANVAPPVGVQALAYEKFSSFAPGQYRVINAGTATVHLGTGSTAAQAQTNAVAAVSGNPAPGIPLLPGAVEILRFNSESYFSGAASGATTVYITPGQGI
jgi:hypothetical protein